MNSSTFNVNWCHILYTKLKNTFIKAQMLTKIKYNAYLYIHVYVYNIVAEHRVYMYVCLK